MHIHPKLKIHFRLIASTFIQLVVLIEHSVGDWQIIGMNNLIFSLNSTSPINSISYNCK